MIGKLKAVATGLAVAALLSGCSGGSSQPASAGGAAQARPGPDILYAPEADAPQLQNTGAWHAAPILISGASAYRSGEFLYQDWLYDDHGAEGKWPDPKDPRNGTKTHGKVDRGCPAGGTYTYPTAANYAGNAADLVEFRLKPQTDATAFRVTLNSMLDPELVAFTLALGTPSSGSRDMPFGANTRSQADWFVTVHGSVAVITRADSGEVAPAPARVAVDVARRQIEVDVPHAVWDPGSGVARLSLGVGLWDGAKSRYLLPDYSATESAPGGRGGLGEPSAFFNVAFRYSEPQSAPPSSSDPLAVRGRWRELLQGQTLATGDISTMHADVDFAKLTSGIDDDMPDQPGGVPQTGSINRLFASHFETQQGVQFADVCVFQGASCKGALLGRLQPYELYVPKKAQPEGGFGLMLLLHSLTTNYNQYISQNYESQLGERGRGYLVLTPEARGQDGAFVEYTGADVFEAWADVARHYPMSADHVSVSGYSMGGYGAFRFTTQFPDLFSSALPLVGLTSIGAWSPPIEPSGGYQNNTYYQLSGLRHVPIMMWVMKNDFLVPNSGTDKQTRAIDELGYRYVYRKYSPGNHMALEVDDSFADAADWLGDRAVTRNPGHISYTVNPMMDFADVGMVADHAYWLADLRVRDLGGDAPRGDIDAVSHGIGQGDPAVQTTQEGSGVMNGGSLGSISYTVQSRDWGDTPASAVEDRLSLTLSNIASLTVYPVPARLDCKAQLDVKTDGPVTVTLAGCNRSEQFGG